MLRPTTQSPLVEVKILDNRIKEWGLPQYQTDWAAAIDLFACLDAPIEVTPGAAPSLISAGIAVRMDDPNLAAVILPRSGLGHKKGLVLGNLVGLIDPDYLGPIMVSAWNRNAQGTEPICISPGDRIAQMMFVPIIRPQFKLVDEFSASTTRGDGGFGSTGH